MAAAISAVHLALVSLLFVPDKMTTFTHVRFLNRQQPKSLYEDSMYTHSLYEHGVQSAEDCKASESLGKPSPIKFSSEVNRMGHPRVGVYSVIDYSEHKEDGAYLLDRCEGLFQTCRELEAQGKLSELPEVLASSQTSSTRMANGSESGLKL